LILDKPVDKSAAIVTRSTVADGRRPRAAGDRPVKVAGQQVSEVPAEPQHGQVIDLMAAFKASLEKRGVAAQTADEAKEKPAARGGARRGPKRTRARRWNGGAGQQEVRPSYLTGTASGEPITERDSPVSIAASRSRTEGWRRGDAAQPYSPRLSR